MGSKSGVGVSLELGLGIKTLVRILRIETACIKCERCENFRYILMRFPYSLPLIRAPFVSGPRIQNI